MSQVYEQSSCSRHWELPCAEVLGLTVLLLIHAIAWRLICQALIQSHVVALNWLRFEHVTNLKKGVHRYSKIIIALNLMSDAFMFSSRCLLASTSSFFIWFFHNLLGDACTKYWLHLAPRLSICRPMKQTNKTMRLESLHCACILPAHDRSRHITSVQS